MGRAQNVRKVTIFDSLLRQKSSPPNDAVGSQSETGEKHWHGAAPTTAMTDIAIQEKLKGKDVNWMEQVSEEQYRKSVGSNSRPRRDRDDPIEIDVDHSRGY